MTSIIVKRDAREDELEGIIKHVSNELGFVEYVLDSDQLDQLTPGLGGKWNWEYYQKRNLRCSGWYACNKPRQAGISTVFAMKAFARAILTNKNFIAVFVSYKKEEAINKVQYVKQFLEALPLAFRKKIVRDPNQLIEWENANKTRAKILSHSQKEVRGLPVDALFLDELAFYSIADAIYDSALPALGQTHGTIDIGSTPFGRGGKYHDIVTDRVKYPNFMVDDIKWWHCTRYLKDPTPAGFIEAMKKAGGLELEERVYTYGNRFLIDMFKNTEDPEVFMQEFEGHFVDASAAFFHRELIFGCCYTHFSSIDDYDPQDGEYIDPITRKVMKVEDALADKAPAIVEKYNDRNINFKRYDSVEELLLAIQQGKVTRNLVGGADFGTSAHASELVVLEEIPIAEGRVLQVERLSIRLKEPLIEVQNVWFESVIGRLGLRAFNFDSGGPGLATGQYLKSRFPGTVKMLNTGGQSNKKELIFTNLKNRFLSQTIAIFHDKEMIEHLYCIERVITETKSVKFVSSEKRRHHSDKACALAYASIAGTPFGHIGSGNFETTVDRTIGYLNIENAHLLRHEADNRVESSMGMNSLSHDEDSSFVSMNDTDGFIDIYK